MAEELIGPMAQQVIAHHKDRAAELVERLHEIWRMSVVAQAELDNGDPHDAMATLVKIASLCAEETLPKIDRA